MKQLPVQKEFEYKVIGSWTMGNPYCLAFVYPRQGKSFVVKGGIKDVDPYLQTFAKTNPCIVHYAYYRNGEARSKRTEVYGLRDGVVCWISSPQWPRENKLDYGPDFMSKPRLVRKVRNVRRCKISVYSRIDSYASTMLFEKYVRHVPRKWMKELNQFV